MRDRYFAVSGYTQAQGEDLLLVRLSPDGTMGIRCGMRAGDNPSCMAFAEGTLYVGFEIEGCARIRRYRVRPEGFTFLGEIEVPGSGLCHLTAAFGGIFGSCYGSGSFFAVDFALEKVLWRYDPQKDGLKHHAHWMVANGPWLYGVDLGADRLLRWPEGVFGDADLPMPEALPLATGSGPRQVLWRTPGEGWVIHETRAAVSMLLQKGTQWRAGSELPLAPMENYPAGACLSRAGVLYVPVRGADTLAALETCPEGAKTLWEQKLPGSWPRFCALTEDERFLLVCLQKSHTLCCFALEAKGIEQVSEISLGGAAYVLELPDMDGSSARDGNAKK